MILVRLIFLSFAALCPSLVCAKEAGRELIFHAPTAEEARRIDDILWHDKEMRLIREDYPFDTVTDVRIAWVALGKQNTELFVSFFSGEYCSLSGCDFHVWKKAAMDWKQIYHGKGDTNADGHSELRILPEKHYGLYDLISLRENVMLRYDGVRYRANDL